MSKKFSAGHCGEDCEDVTKILEYLSGALFWIAVSLRDVVKKWWNK